MENFLPLVNEMMAAIAAKYGNVINDGEQTAIFNFAQLTPVERKVVAASESIAILSSVSEKSTALYNHLVSVAYENISDLKLYLSLTYRQEQMCMNRA